MDDDAIIARVRDLVARGEGSEGATYPPAREEDVAATEQEIGARLPALLRRLYLEVGNGGFGPGFGIAGVRGGHRVDFFGTLDEGYAVSRAPDPNWPAGLVTLVDFGCAQFVYLATLDHAESMVVLAHNELIICDLGLRAFLATWLDGRDAFSELHHEPQGPPRIGINPFTKQRMAFQPPLGPPRGKPWPGYKTPESWGL